MRTVRGLEQRREPPREVERQGVLLVGGVNRVYAQEFAPGPGTVEVTVIPGGATFFTNSGTGSSFGNYNVGAATTYNVNRFVGIEGELSAVHRHAIEGFRASLLRAGDAIRPSGVRRRDHQRASVIRGTETVKERS
jgi:hypothetical protein